MIATKRNIKKNRANSGGSDNTQNNITRVKTHKFTSVTLSSGLAQVAVNAASAVLGATAQMADSFDLYRVRKLKYRILPETRTGAQTMAYYPETVVTVATNTINSENTDCVVLPGGQTYASDWAVVPPARLKAQLDWYKCIADASAGEFEDQGVLAFVGNASESVFFEVRATIEFKNPVDSAVMLNRAMKRAGFTRK